MGFVVLFFKTLSYNDNHINARYSVSLNFMLVYLMLLTHSVKLISNLVFWNKFYDLKMQEGC